MVKKVVLHIGMHKTGSSSIQNALSGYDDGKVRYANLDFANHSVPIYTAFMNDCAHYRPHLQASRDALQIEAMRQKTLEKLATELSLGREILIISGEDMVAMTKEALQNLCAFISDRCANIEVIGYARDPVGFASSSTQNLINTNVVIEDFHVPNYREFFEKFLSVFGKENVSIHKFDPAGTLKGSVVDHFCSLLGLTIDSEAGRKDNVSMNGTAISLLWRFNKSGTHIYAEPRLRSAYKRLTEFLQQHTNGPKFKIPQKIVLEKIEMSDLDWLSENAGISFQLPPPHSASDGSAPSFEEFISGLSDGWGTELINKDLPYVPMAEVSSRPDMLVNAIFSSFLLQSWDEELRARDEKLRARDEKLRARDEKLRARDEKIQALVGELTECKRIKYLTRRPGRYLGAYIQYKFFKVASRLPVFSNATRTDYADRARAIQPF